MASDHPVADKICSGVAYFFGGLMQVLGGVMEWIIGNTFPSVVFSTFGEYGIAIASRNVN